MAFELTITKKDTLPASVSASSGLAAVNGTVVVVSGNSFPAVVYRSANTGDTWTTSTQPFNSINALAHNGTYFLAIGIDGSFANIWGKSTDGITWTSGAAPSSSAGNSLAWSGTRWVMTDNGNSIYHSTDGQTWSTVVVAGSMSSVIWDGARFCAVSQSNSAPYPYTFYTSADGITWTNTGSISATNSYNFGNVIHTGSAYASSNANDDIHRSSPTGVTWTAIVGLTGTLLGNMSGYGLMTTAVSGGSATDFKISSDGATWTPVTDTLVGSGTFGFYINRPRKSGTKIYAVYGNSLLILDLIASASSFWTSLTGTHEVI